MAEQGQGQRQGQGQGQGEGQGKVFAHGHGPDPSNPKSVGVLKKRKSTAFAVPITVRGAPVPQSIIQSVDPEGKLPVIIRGLPANVTIDNAAAFTVVGGVQ